MISGNELISKLFLLLFGKRVKNTTMIAQPKIKHSKRSRQRPFRRSSVPATEPPYFVRKRTISRIVGAVLLVAFSPVILVSMALVRLTSPGPSLYKQQRLGKGGDVFDVIKIRTMYCDAEKLTGPKLCQPGDSRITPIGRIFRFLHIDELPQLLNVIRGEMCLVGPRPERPEIIKENKLNELVPGFAERTRVLPGVTGLAQVNLPADLTVDCVIPKVQLDLEYIETASGSLDIRILLCTALRILGIRYGIAVKTFSLNRNGFTQTAKVPRATESLPQLSSKSMKCPDPVLVGEAAEVSSDDTAAATSSIHFMTEVSENHSIRDSVHPKKPK